MNMFTDGFAGVDSLTDEALGISDRLELQADNTEELPQEPAPQDMETLNLDVMANGNEFFTDEALLAAATAEQQTPDAKDGFTANDSEPAPAEDSAQPQKETKQKTDEATRILQERLGNAQRWGHEQSLRLAEAKRRIEQLEAAQQEARIAAQMADPQKREDALKKLMENPLAFTQEALIPAVQKVVNQALAPLHEAQQNAQRKKVFSAGIQSVVESYSAAASKEAQKQLIAEAVKLCHENGDTKANMLWNSSPMVLHEAARRLWGIPARVDQGALDAAIKQMGSAHNADVAAREAGKAALGAKAHYNSQVADRERSAEDEILSSIMAQENRRLFG